MAEPDDRPHKSFVEFLACVEVLAGQELFEVLRRGPDQDHLWMLGGPPTIREFKTNAGIEALREVWDRLSELRTTGKDEIRQILAARWIGQFPEDNTAIVANGVWSCLLLHGDKVGPVASRSSVPPQTVVYAAAPPPPLKPFSWNQIDHSLVILKLAELSEDIRKEIGADESRLRFETQKGGNAAAFPSGLLGLHERWTDEWARRTFEVYCDVWRKQGYTPSAPFVREVCAQGVIPLIRARKGAVAFELELLAKRTNRPNMGAVLNAWASTMSRAEGRWTRRLEAHAKECEHADRVGRRVNSSPPEGFVACPETVPTVVRSLEIEKLSFEKVVDETMAGRTVWRDLEDRFRALQARDNQGDPLCASWSSIGWKPAGEKWKLYGGTKRTRTQFPWLAERAGTQLGHAGGPQSALFFWLNLLRSESPNSRGFEAALKDKDASTVHSTSIVIESLCEASAEYCVRCESLQKAQTEKASREAFDTPSEDDGNGAGYPGTTEGTGGVAGHAEADRAADIRAEGCEKENRPGEAVSPSELGAGIAAGENAAGNGVLDARGRLRVPLGYGFVPKQLSQSPLKLVNLAGSARKRTKVANDRAGDPSLLDGKQAVPLHTADLYLDLSSRQRQKLCKKGTLDVIGKGHYRKITTDSLRRYRAPEKTN